MILFDAHVHIYDCFDIATFFEAAAENFAAAAQKNGDQADCARFLLLTESNGLDYFQKLPELLSNLNGKQKNPYWNIEEKEPGLSYVVSKNDQPKDEMIIVAGRQLVTAEGLELLALMTADKFEDGMSLEEAVGKVTGSGGIAVCPWGAGKWLGRRGKVLQQFLQKTSGGFFLGDSGGRPSVWPRSKFFSRAPYEAKLVSGSDPLPLKGMEKVAGSFGGILEGVCVKDRPAAHLKKILLQEATTVRPFGRLMGPVTFAKAQIALRMKK